MGVGVAITTFIRFPLLILLGFLCHGSESIAGGVAAVRCIEEERQALVDFKAALTDTWGRLSSWIGDDCCSWRGVGCSNVTAHVIKLDLPNQEGYMTSLGGKLSPSLLKLEQLNYLDLSFNNFQGTQIPEFMGSLDNLRYLDLSHASFSGTIPPHLGNLSRLQYLDLNGDEELTINDIQWLSGLSSLRYLNMNSVSFRGKASSHDWIQAVTMLPSLLELHLSECGLSNIPFSFPYANLTSLLLLELSENIFNTTIPPWLFNITSLSVLDLSFNHLNGPIPDIFANTSSLHNLDLSDTDIGGRLPTTLGNLCNMQRLDLSWCSNINGEITEYVNSLSMCKSSSLETLDLQATGVSGVITSSIGHLLSLIELDLFSTQISGPIPSSIGNLSSLRILVLAETQITGPIPISIGGLSSLTRLDVSKTQITGPIPMSIGNLSSLRILDLAETQITGPIPMSIGGLSSLTELYVWATQINGTVPESLGELSKLERLAIPGNSLSGVISERHFKNVKNLTYLSIESEEPNKALVFEASSDWIPSFNHLEEIQISNIQMGPKFPSWLATQNKLYLINLTKVGISGTIPDSFWNLCARQEISTLDLSHNQIKGRVPNFVEFFNARVVDLSFNRIEGSFPLWSNVSYLYLRANLFRGQIPHNLGEVLGSAITRLDFSGNFLNGSIPSSIGELTCLEVLDLSNNSLWGELPHSWNNKMMLMYLDLSYNNLSGELPESIGALSLLEFLILSNNNFHGRLPTSLQNCTLLLSIDLGRNGFSGEIPTWIGEGVSSLVLMRLHSNFFTGKIPAGVCRLSMLHILDISHNNLSRFIPQCLGNLSALKSMDRWVGEFYHERMMVITKGRELEYSTTLLLVKSIDLSSNHLSGEIPNGITRLVELGTLNLSMNHLTGLMPEKIGYLQKLETLDLSINELSGQIPPSISSLTFLSHLNLSYNNLSGKIPSSTQLQSIGDASMYTGNPGLCGLPLPINCSGSDISPPPAGKNEDEEEGEQVDMLWFYIGAVMGFIVGFWAVWGTLFFKNSWRIAYFRFCSLC